MKKWKLEQDLFQVELAKRIGVSEMTIVNWEKGRTKPEKKNLERIGMILRFDLSPLSQSPPILPPIPIDTPFLI
jgi:DNA-binding XRE family transcriptional regulator